MLFIAQSRRGLFQKTVCLGGFYRHDPCLGKLFRGSGRTIGAFRNTRASLRGLRMMDTAQGYLVADTPVDSMVQVPLFQPSICAQVNMYSQRQAGFFIRNVCP